MYIRQRCKYLTLNQTQDKFLEAVGVTAKAALVDFNLAPLSSRRDMAMLGLLHRVQLGLAPQAYR